MARQKKEGMDDFVDALREWLGIGPIPQSPAAARENARQDHGAMEECVDEEEAPVTEDLLEGIGVYLGEISLKLDRLPEQRDRIAEIALQVFLEDGPRVYQDTPGGRVVNWEASIVHCAERAYLVADAMIAARRKKPVQP